jgi:hypothetical protein
MKNQLPLLTAVALFAVVSAAQAQPPVGATPFTTLSGPTIRLFGINSSFTATVETRTSAQDARVEPLRTKLYYDQGTYRFDLDMINAARGTMTSEATRQMQTKGLDSLIVIARPDLAVRYTIYPKLNAYVESRLTDIQPAKAERFKLETSQLGTDTVDGLACVKNRAIVTDGNGVANEYTVWNAKDLRDFPVKMEQTQGGLTATMTFKDVKLDRFPPSVFDLPSGAKKYPDVATLTQEAQPARGSQSGKAP